MAEVDPKFLQRSPEQIRLEASDKSDAYDAFLSGLTNDETAKIAWLANKRFPNAAEQGDDPMDYYYIDGDGDIAYRDPVSGDFKKEFQEFDIFGFGVDVEDVFGSVFPTLQFLTEVIGGAGGLIYGGVTGGIPGAITGGVAGTAAAGGGMYTVRSALSQMLDGPLLETEKMTSDLAISSAAGGLPFGAPAKSFGSFAGGLVKKFPGADGRKQLQNIITEGGDSVDAKIQFAQDRFGVTLTRPEAQMTLTNGAQLQYFLSKQPTSQKLWDFYHDRALQVQDIADEFFSELQSGKYVKEGVKNKLSGKGSLNAQLDVAKAADAVLKKLAKKRQERATKMYEDAYDVPDVNIDVSDLVSGLDEKLADKNVKGNLRKAYVEMRKSLIDQNTGDVKNTTKLLHEGLYQDFTPLIETLTKDNQKFIKRQVADLKRTVSSRLKEANPLYKLATDVYDPSKGHLQVLEKSIVNAFAKASERGGQNAVNTVNRMFKGSATPKEITDLKRLLQAEFVDEEGITRSGAQDWQNVKGAWLQTQFDDAISGSINPLGAPNRFLSSIGIRGNIKTVFPAAGTREIGQEASELAAEQAVVRGRKAKILEAILEPDELNNFVDLVELMQMTSYIATQSASPTQSLQAMKDILVNEGTRLGVWEKGKQITMGAVNLVPRLLNKGFGDIQEKVIATQKEAYEELLIEALINPKKAVELRQFMDSIDPMTYLMAQTFARGGVEGLTELAETTDERNTALMEEKIQRRDEEATRKLLEQEATQAQEAQNLSTRIQDFKMPQVDAPLFEPEADLAPQEMLSPTILPSEKDREIASRQLGIGSLA